MGDESGSSRLVFFGVLSGVLNFKTPDTAIAAAIRPAPINTYFQVKFSVLYFLMDHFDSSSPGEHRTFLYNSIDRKMAKITGLNRPSIGRLVSESRVASPSPPPRRTAPCR